MLFEIFVKIISGMSPWILKFSALFSYILRLLVSFCARRLGKKSLSALAIEPETRRSSRPEDHPAWHRQSAQEYDALENAIGKIIDSKSEQARRKKAFKLRLKADREEARVLAATRTAGAEHETKLERSPHNKVKYSTAQAGPGYVSSRV